MTENITLFCTPECAKAIDNYLDYRQRHGEKLAPDAPLIREMFDRDDQLKARNPKPLKRFGFITLIRDLIRKAGIQEVKHLTEDGQIKYSGQVRKDIPLHHGFRKFFNTALMNADVNLRFKELLMGHTIKLDDVYYDKNSQKSQDKLLEEYSKAIDYLTINEENRLRKKVELLKAKRDEIEMLKGQVQQKDDRLSVIETQMQAIVSALGTINQSGKNEIAKQLVKRSVYRPTESNPNNNG